MKRYAMEGMGTFFLMYAILLSASKTMFLPGLMLFALLYVGGHISGGHFNPAITIATVVKGTLDRVSGLWYVISQSVGAFLAAMLYYKLAGEPFELILPEGAAPALTALEALFTMLFCLVMLTVTTSPRFKTTLAYPAAIGVALMAIATLGFAVNPAVGIASLLCSAVHQLGFSGPICMVYIVGPAIGGILSSFVYSFFNEQ